MRWCQRLFKQSLVPARCRKLLPAKGFSGKCGARKSIFSPLARRQDRHLPSYADMSADDQLGLGSESSSTTRS